MRTLKVYFIISLIASVFASCDLFFPYSLEDAPQAPETENPPVDDSQTDTDEPTPEPVDLFGTFLIGVGKYVKFAPGNLQYNAYLDEWRFAQNQYDVIGYENGNISSTYKGWIDLFGWGTGDSPTKKSQYSSDYTYFTDWGDNIIGNDPKNTWRTLTSEEWSRIQANSKIGLGMIEGVPGIILLPAQWERPSNVTFNSGFGDGFHQNEYTKEKWQLMESAGAVFLPRTGYRKGTSYYSQSSGYYWSSSRENKYSYNESGNRNYYYYYSFSSSTNKVETYEHTNSYYGYAVRLVKEIRTY